MFFFFFERDIPCGMERVSEKGPRDENLCWTFIELECGLNTTLNINIDVWTNYDAIVILVSELYSENFMLSISVFKWFIILMS